MSLFTRLPAARRWLNTAKQPLSTSISISRSATTSSTLVSILQYQTHITTSASSSHHHHPSRQLHVSSFTSSSSDASSSSASNNSGGGPTADEIARIRQIAESVGKNVEEGIEELKGLYGATMHADKVWMSDFYRHKQHKYLVPALALGCTEDKQGASMPSISAKNAVFYSHVLRAYPDVVAQSAATLSMTPGIDIGLLLSIMQLVNTPVSKQITDRLAVSIRRSNNRALIRVGQHIASITASSSSSSVMDWPMPYDQADVLEAGWKKNSLPPQPWEVSGMFTQARDALDFHDWLLVSSTTVVECLWAVFYATGNRESIRRLCAIAADWSETGGKLPNAVEYLANIEAPLPDSIRAKGTTPQESAVSVRAQVSRAAIWSLLHHTQRHPAVFATIAEECGRLAQMVADPSAREPAGVAASGLVPGGNGGLGSTSSTIGSTQEAVEKVVRRRLEVLPALLHLIARTRLDTPYTQKKEE